MTDVTIAYPALSGATVDQAGVIARLKLGLRRFRVYHATRTELTRLTDRDLSDISVARDQINQIARRAASRVV